MQETESFKEYLALDSASSFLPPTPTMDETEDAKEDTKEATVIAEEEDGEDQKEVWKEDKGYGGYFKIKIILMKTKCT